MGLGKIGVMGGAGLATLAVAYIGLNALCGGKPADSKAKPNTEVTIECKVDDVAEISRNGWHVLGFNRKGPRLGYVIEADCSNAGRRTFYAMGYPNLEKQGDDSIMPEGFKVENGKTYLITFNPESFQPNVLTKNPQPK
ncbi:hypothetical protein HYY74_05720 [Candidatus Woesearchaeota archaeon]|nr:hypothetical protein [Candidatus Woesearchaeota archaeon]